jgi:peptidylamidoglycolate lyase
MKHPLLLFMTIILISCHPRPSTPVAYPCQHIWIRTWPQLPQQYLLGNPSGMAVDTAGNIIVFHRGSKKWPLLVPFSKAIIQENTILILDPATGRILDNWGKGIFIMPHSLTIDKANNIWVTDIGLQQVLKFTHDGKLLFRVGEPGVPGNDSTHFNRPTDVAVTPDGSFYVSDGYRNSRIVKFSPAGHYLFAWGKKGSGPGQFDIPHSLTLDDSGNVYVADRENSRIQVFTPSGALIKEWKNESFGKMYAIRYDPIRKEFIAADYITNYIRPKGSDILIFDSTGRILQRFGRTCNYIGPTCRYHSLAIDRQGSIYAGDILKNTLQKFQLQPGRSHNSP